MTVYVPGSKIPFKPLNPWGRAMPKPTREMRPKKPSLYQVRVEKRDGTEIPVGPKMHLEQAEQFCEAISVMISRGHEKDWSSPRVVEIKPPSQDNRTLGELLSSTSM